VVATASARQADTASARQVDINIAIEVVTAFATRVGIAFVKRVGTDFANSFVSTKYRPFGEELPCHTKRSISYSYHSP